MNSILKITLPLIGCAMFGVLASQAPAAANVAPHDEKQLESTAFSCFFYKNGDVGCAKSEGRLSNVDFSQIDEEIPAKSIEALLSELDKALAEEGGDTLYGEGGVAKVDGRISAEEAALFIALVDFLTSDTVSG